jgi:hypothetical protein
MVFAFRDNFSYKPYSGYTSLYGACSESCEKKWKQYADDYSFELKEAKQITDPIVQRFARTSDKVIAIELFLYRRFHNQLGLPAPTIQQSSPLIQFKKLSASDTEQLWCGNFAQMLSLFCWSQGIVTRNIELLHAGDHHVVNECYLPETKSWMMADITTNLLGVTDQNKNLLNLILFKASLKTNARLSVMQADSLQLVKAELKIGRIAKQYLADDPINFYHYLDNRKAYTLSKKIKRYFLPVSWYETYEYKKAGNLAFYLKEIFIFLWLVLFFIFLFIRPKHKI